MLVYHNHVHGFLEPCTCLLWSGAYVNSLFCITFSLKTPFLHFIWLNICLIHFWIENDSGSGKVSYDWKYVLGKYNTRGLWFIFHLSPKYWVGLGTAKINIAHLHPKRASHITYVLEHQKYILLMSTGMVPKCWI